MPRMLYCAATACSLLVTVAMSTPLATASGASLDLEQGTYKMGKKKPMYGPTLPIKGPIIQVFAESGTHYSHVAGTNGTVYFLTKYTASCTGNREGSSIEIKLHGTTAEDSSLSDKFETGQIGLNVPYADVKELAPQAWCNDQAKTLSLEHNTSLAAIVEHGFTMKVDHRVPVHGTLFCRGKGLTKSDVDSDDTALDVWLRCRGNEDAGKTKPSRAPKRGTSTKSGDPGPGETSTIFTRARLTGPSGTLEQSCPAPLKYTISITARGRGDIQYRIVGEGDYASPQKSMSFEAAGTQTSNWTRMARVPEADGMAYAPTDEHAADISGWQVSSIIWMTGNPG